MPVALISISASPAFGPSSCTVSSASGAPALCATAARTSMLLLLVIYFLNAFGCAGAAEKNKRRDRPAVVNCPRIRLRLLPRRNGCVTPFDFHKLNLAPAPAAAACESAHFPFLVPVSVLRTACGC